MKKEIEQLKKELWKEFCLKMKAELKKITDPLVENPTLRSYDALEDVITNVILFEMNIDKEPWEQIKKRDIRLPLAEEYIKNINKHLTPKIIAEVLIGKIDTELYGVDEPEKMKRATLFLALKNYLTK
jgi:hypothetical protein